MIDVLVAGGGPIGLATAILAVEAGLTAVVAEPRPTPIDKACGEGLMPPGLDRLRRLGVEPEGRVLRGIRYVDPSGSVDGPFKYGPGRGVRRTALHSALAERAAKAGITTIPAHVSGFEQRAGGVEALGLYARYLVAADGLHSPIRRACGLEPSRPRHPRYGLRRHFHLAPWTDFVEVHWADEAEAYVTPVADDLVGVAVLGPAGTGFTRQLEAFPALGKRLAGVEPAGPDRGAGPLRQAVRRRVAGRVLLVGDASGYVDALTGEGISVGLAQAEALVACLAADRPQDYERAWRRASRRSNLLTSALLATRRTPVVGARLVPAARALPTVFGAAVNLVTG